MLGIFKRKPNKSELERKYQKLMDEVFKLSSTDQALSKQKMAEAEEVMKEISKLN